VKTEHGERQDTFNIQHKTVVPYPVELLRQTTKNTCGSVVYLADLTVLNVGCVDNIGAKRCTDALMSKADPQDGYVDFSYEPSVEAKVCFSLRCARAWG
jgi:hypothetical protein